MLFYILLSLMVSVLPAFAGDGMDVPLNLVEGVDYHETAPGTVYVADPVVDPDALRVIDLAALQLRVEGLEKRVKELEKKAK